MADEKPFFRRIFYLSIVYHQDLRNEIRKKIQGYGGELQEPQPNRLADYVLADKDNLHCVKTTVEKINEDIPWYDYRVLDYWIETGYMDVAGAKKKGYYIGPNNLIKINNTIEKQRKRKREMVAQIALGEIGSKSSVTISSCPEKRNKAIPMGNILVLNYQYDELPGRLFTVEWKAQSDSFLDLKKSIDDAMQHFTKGAPVDYGKIRAVSPFTLDWSCFSSNGE